MLSELVTCRGCGGHVMRAAMAAARRLWPRWAGSLRPVRDRGRRGRSPAGLGAAKGPRGTGKRTQGLGTPGAGRKRDRRDTGTEPNGAGEERGISTDTGTGPSRAPGARLTPPSVPGELRCGGERGVPEASEGGGGGTPRRAPEREGTGGSGLPAPPPGRSPTKSPNPSPIPTNGAVFL